MGFSRCGWPHDQQEWRASAGGHPREL